MVLYYIWSTKSLRLFFNRKFFQHPFLSTHSRLKKHRVVCMSFVVVSGDKSSNSPKNLGGSPCTWCNTLDGFCFKEGKGRENWPPKKNIWVFPKIGVPQNGWFIMENLIKMDDLGVPLFFGNIHIGGKKKGDKTTKLSFCFLTKGRRE